jgi:hypothetical protein
MRLPKTIASYSGILKMAMLGALMLYAPGALADGERLTISMVNYRGKGEAFEQFRSRFRDWMLTLSECIPATVKVNYLSRLKLIERETEFPSDDALKKYWKEGDALQVVSSVSIDKDAGDKYFVSTRIYLGELQGQFPRDSILIEVPFAVRDYADTKDFHTAVMLYGLAMDAERVDHSRKALIAQFLKSAKDKLTDIKNRNALESKRNSPRSDLEWAIAEAEKKVKGP